MREEYEPLYKMAGMVYGFRKEKGRFVHTFAMGNLLTRLGYTPQDFLNHDLQEIFPDGTIADQLEEVYERAWRGKEQGMVMMQLSGIPILGSLTPVRQKGKITDVVVIWMELFLKERFSIIGLDRSFATSFDEAYPLSPSKLNPGTVDIGKLFQKEDFSLLRYASVMVLLLNREGKILYASPVAADYLGLDWEGKGIGEWLEEEGSLLSALQNLPGNKTIERRIRLRRGEKGERIFQVWLTRISPDFDYGAKRDRFLWIGRDISRQASQEEFLEKSSHLAMIQEFAAGVAHELRNPITTIRGFLTLLQQESKGISREGVSYFPMILAEIDKIEEVVNHFLLFAKSSRAKKEEVLLRSILEEVIRDAEQEGLIEKDGITALFDGENPIVMGNREMLKLSFKNLLRYILEGKDEGSPLTVKGERDEGNFYSIRFIYVDVRTKEIVEKAGLPHYSLNEKGIGIEMMISYKVIADHMGQIAIERDEGKTLLQVLLPYSRASSYETELEEQILGRSELTNREKEVLKLVCLGYKNKEISEQLMISEHTVKNHVSNILQKLELNDRSQLMVMFLHPQKGMKSST